MKAVSKRKSILFALLALLLVTLLMHWLTLPPKAELLEMRPMEPRQYAAERNLAPRFLGAYKPEREITRLAFVSLLGESFSAKRSYSGLTTDVGEEMPGSRYVDWAVDNDLIDGLERTEEGGSFYNRQPFHPNETLTQEQMADILGRLLETGCLDIDMPEETIELADTAEITPAIRARMETLVSLGILQTDAQGSIHPKKPVTQEEALTAVVRLFQKAKNTRPPANDGASVCVEYFARDAMYERILLRTVPAKMHGAYGKGWRCVSDLETYREIVQEINPLIETTELATPRLDSVALDESFFEEHNLIVLNQQSFADPQFQVSIRQQVLGKHTLWVMIKTYKHYSSTADGVGYLFLITVPKEVTQLRTWYIL